MGVSRVPALPNVLLTFSLVLVLVQNEAPQKPEMGGHPEAGSKPPEKKREQCSKGKAASSARHANYCSVGQVAHIRRAICHGLVQAYFS